LERESEGLPLQARREEELLRAATKNVGGKEEGSSEGRRGEEKVEPCADPDLFLILRRGDAQGLASRDAKAMLREEADFPAYRVVRPGNGH